MNAGWGEAYVRGNCGIHVFWFFEMNLGIFRITLMEEGSSQEQKTDCA